MMNKLTLAFLFCAWSVTTNAQQLLVAQAVQVCSKGEQTAFQVLIPEAKLKNVETGWKKKLKTKSKAKVEEIGGEYIIYGAIDENIASGGFNVFSKLLETTEGVVLTVWFMRSDSVFISRESAPDKSLAVEKYVRDFAVEEYRQVVSGQLNTENKKLSELESDLKQLINNEEKANKKINENERSISRTKADIRSNENDQKVKEAEVKKQKAVVESLKTSPGDAYKGAQKTLKQFESELKKQVSENEKMHKQIDKMEAEIREEQRNIAQSVQEQYQKRADIDKQKTVVKTFEEKLSSIK